MIDANEDWFKTSCRMYMPDLCDYMQRHGIELISDRDRYEIGEPDFKLCKRSTFRDELEAFMQHFDNMQNT